MGHFPIPAQTLPPPTLDWAGHNPALTRLFEALSLLAPEAERLFIGTVREHAAGLTDPELFQACRRFIQEEGQHSLSHRAFNQRLWRHAAHNPVGLWTQTLFRLSAQLPARWQLALTCAGEHLSAALSAEYLRDSLSVVIEDPQTRALYHQHALEEWGHRAVAFDLMQARHEVGYGLRITAFAAVSLAVPLCIYETCIRLSPHMVWRLPLLGLKTLIQPSHWPALGRFTAAYLRYLQPGFHPA